MHPELVLPQAKVAQRSEFFDLQRNGKSKYNPKSFSHHERAGP